jgi:hypothetical protein
MLGMAGRGATRASSMNRGRSMSPQSKVTYDENYGVLGGRTRKMFGPGYTVPYDMPAAPMPQHVHAQQSQHQSESNANKTRVQVRT